MPSKPGVNPKDIPTKMMKTNVIPGSKGHEGVVIQSSLGEGTDGKFSGKDSIGTHTRTKNVN